MAWGIDDYYDTKIAGKGYFKTYYMNERKIPKRIYKLPHVPAPTEKERYRIQWRHQWDVDKDTYWLAEYHKLNEIKFIEDYFYAENEKNTKPVSYILFSHRFPESATFSVLTQKRTNRIFTETEKLPEVKLEMPSAPIFETPLYLSNSSAYVNLNNKLKAPSEIDESSQRVDNYTVLSLPFKLAFLDVNPYSGARETYYRRISGRDAEVFREAWNSGVDVTTRFYRIYDTDTQLLGMEFHKLRHIITPNVNYSYTHKPTVSPSKLLQLDGIDSISESNQIGFSLENKIQTKREGQTVDFFRFIGSRNYLLNIEGRRHGWNDTSVYDLEMLPYDWLRFESDATYDHILRSMTLANFDIKASGGKIAVGTGYRYERRTSSQVTAEVELNIFKGWSFKVYERLQLRGSSLLKEQNYSVTKDLHCWIFDINYNVLREKGETIWLALRLKAFPELAIDYNQYYHDPKAGSQGYAGGKPSD